MYGKIIVEQKQNFLTINFKGHDNLTATVKYLDNNDWIIEYNNILYGIFPIQFELDKNKVKGVTIKMNSFIELDDYKFTKQ
ncbi:MAG: hypothetical protein V9E96_00585 [Chitinophagaceae bacterium]